MLDIYQKSCVLSFSGTFQKTKKNVICSVLEGDLFHPNWIIALINWKMVGEKVKEITITAMINLINRRKEIHNVLFLRVFWLLYNPTENTLNIMLVTVNSVLLVKPNLTQIFCYLSKGQARTSPFLSIIKLANNSYINAGNETISYREGSRLLVDGINYLISSWHILFGHYPACSLSIR